MARAIRGESEQRSQLYFRKVALSYLRREDMGGCTVASYLRVLSEDFQDGVLLEGVRFLNPLRAGSRAQEWLESI